MLLSMRTLALLALSSLSVAVIASATEPAAPANPAATDPAATAVAPAPATASAAIDALHASLLDVMKNAVALGYSGREQRLKTVIPRYFDVNEMAKKSLGPHWNSLDPASRQRYLDTFARFTVANYAGRFDGYSGQSFETLGETPGPRDTMIVKSRLIDPTDKNIDLNYRMHRTDGTWKVVDVYLDGTVSELALRRSEFVSIVKRQNLDALLVALDAKIAKLAAGQES
jgi:phospholipid transport system substrate-binding protein